MLEIVNCALWINILNKLDDLRSQIYILCSILIKIMENLFHWWAKALYTPLTSLVYQRLMCLYIEVRRTKYIDYQPIIVSH